MQLVWTDYLILEELKWKCRYFAGWLTKRVKKCSKIIKKNSKNNKQMKSQAKPRQSKETTCSERVCMLNMLFVYACLRDTFNCQWFLVHLVLMHWCCCQLLFTFARVLPSIQLNPNTGCACLRKLQLLRIIFHIHSSIQTFPYAIIVQASKTGNNNPAQTNRIELQNTAINKLFRVQCKKSILSIVEEWFKKTHTHRN